MNTYLVGGAVRDQLLGREVHEKDWVVVGATPEDMIEQGYRPVGKDFPVFLHPQTHEEYALARTERKTAPGYHGFVFHTGLEVTLEQDLKRRDLTINAMARDEAGTIIDPYGGQEDLQRRTLRHVSDAFREDPVRILRVARFYARYYPLGFEIADETMTLMQEMVASGEADTLQGERVWQETRRALDCDNPQAFFLCLQQCHALGRIFPEVQALFGVPQTPRYHPEIDTGVHTMMVLQQAAAKQAGTEVRYACLVHDLGKALTPGDVLPGHRGHESRGIEPVTEISKRLGVPKQFRELALIVTRFHLHAHRAQELKAQTLLKLLEQTDALRKPDRFNDFLLACECDAQGREGLQDAPYPQAAYLREALQVITEIDPQTVIKPEMSGQAIGQALHQARLKALKAWKAGNQSESRGRP